MHDFKPKVLTSYIAWENDYLDCLWNWRPPKFSQSFCKILNIVKKAFKIDWLAWKYASYARSTHSANKVQMPKTLSHRRFETLNAQWRILFVTRKKFFQAES